MNKKEKLGKRTLIFAGISVICIAVGTLSWGYYQRAAEFKNSKCDFVPPSSFDEVVQQIDVENSQMVVLLEKNVAIQDGLGDKSVVLNCEKVDYKLYNTKPGDRIEFFCDEKNLGDNNVEIYNFTREK